MTEALTPAPYPDATEPDADTELQLARVKFGWTQVDLAEHGINSRHELAVITALDGLRPGQVFRKELIYDRADFYPEAMSIDDRDETLRRTIGDLALKLRAATGRPIIKGRSHSANPKYEMRAAVWGLEYELRDVRYSPEQLRQRQIEILDMHFGLDGQMPHTIAEIAKLYNIAPRKVRLIEAEALEVLSKGETSPTDSEP